MSKYLVVAHQTASSPELLIGLTDLLKSDPGAQFVLVVPETHVKDLEGVREGDSRQIAKEAALDAKDDLQYAGLRVLDAVVGNPLPLKAVEEEFERSGPYHGVVVCAFPPGLSRWLKFDLPHQVERKLHIPVFHIVAEPARVAV